MDSEEFSKFMKEYDSIEPLTRFEVAMYMEEIKLREAFDKYFLRTRELIEELKKEIIG